MELEWVRRCGGARAGVVAILTVVLAGCMEQQSEPAPVFLRGAGGEPAFAAMPSAAPGLQVVVKRGQTLDGFAYTYHVPKSAIIAANGLHPPYELKIGARLTIPGRHAPVQQAMRPTAATPSVA
ncbi:MAG: LysM peptidoglycan-binding domain-containing protein, partial [Alphaproteobacteria bacterium]|nr:LysM peptidoglycan-binding domain-containing protein [Alphaproteobacteria bacterium]